MTEDLETQLRDALRVCDPPAELTRKIISRLARERRGHRRQWLPAFVVATAVLACALVTTVVRYERAIERQQAEQARARLVYALRLTTAEIAWTQKKLNRAAAAAGAKPRRQETGKSPESL
jgi:hypothetical protein